MVRTLRIVAVAAVLATACGAEQAASRQQAAAQRTTVTPVATPTTRTEDGCAVTVPPQPAFVPPEPYPARPPELYQAEWYGTADLWTMLAPEGEVWEGLPLDHGKLTQKIIWWSDDRPASDEQPSAIRLTGRRLDHPSSFEEGGSRGFSFREDIGHFMMTGVAIPAGCWEITARYKEAELSYVVLVKS